MSSHTTCTKAQNWLRDKRKSLSARVEYIDDQNWEANSFNFQMEEGCDENTVSVGQYVGHFQVPKNSHFQNKAKCVTFLLLRFLHTRRKNHFQINGFALSLALRQRLGATRKWTWMVCSLLRAVEKVLSSRLIMKSRRLWNSHRTKGTSSWGPNHQGTFSNLKSRKCHFQGFSRVIFHRGRHVISSQYKQDWKLCRRNVPGVSRHRTVRTFQKSKPV